MALNITRDAVSNSVHHTGLDPFYQTYGLSSHGFFAPYRIQTFSAFHLDVDQIEIDLKDFGEGGLHGRQVRAQPRGLRNDRTIHVGETISLGTQLSDDV